RDDATVATKEAKFTLRTLRRGVKPHSSRAARPSRFLTASLGGTPSYSTAWSWVTMGLESAGIALLRWTERVVGTPSQTPPSLGRISSVASPWASSAPKRKLRLWSLV